MVAADLLDALVAAEITSSIWDETQYDVVHGERVDLPNLSAFAHLVAKRLFRHLDQWDQTTRRGTATHEALQILDEDDDLRRRPDVAYVSAERWAIDREVPPTGDWSVVPTLAIEVISPHDAVETVIAKLVEYFECGVEQVWLVLPESQFVYCYPSSTEVRMLTPAETLEGGSLLPGFVMPLAGLFDRRVGA